MKKSHLLLTAASALVWSACTLNDAEPVTTRPAQTELTPVAFDTYAGGYAGTRGGATGTLTLDGLKTAGFGVFAYLSDNSKGDKEYNPNTSQPNFMNNQQVAFANGAWTYSPLKYWPNETVTDRQNAGSDSKGTDRLSFLAYAPYARLSSDRAEFTLGDLTFVKTSDAESGIIGFTQKGDTYVAFRVASKPVNDVDFVWGTAASSVVDGEYKPVKTGDDSIQYAANQPMINLSKPEYNQNTLKFQFHHALTRFEADIQAAIDQATPGGTLDDHTKILIEELKITPITSGSNTQFGEEGYFNLNTPYNTTWTGTQGWTITKHHNVSTFDTVQPEFLYDPSKTALENFNDETRTGVTGELKDLFGMENGKRNAWLFIPENNFDGTFDISMKYHILTKDSHLAGGCLDQLNEIHHSADIAFKMGMAYTLKIVIGMTSVNFTVTNEDDWGGLSTDHNIYLPQNN